MSAKIIELISGVLKCDMSVIGEEDNLVDLGMDSLKAIELVVGLEEKFDIMIDEEDLLIENLSTVSDIQELVVRCMEEA